MQVQAVKFSHPPITRPRSVLALARITLVFDNHQITLDDLRVVQNRQGELWIAMPSMKDAHGSYQPIVEFSSELKRLVTAKILPAYEQWSLRASAQPAQTQIGGAAQ
jgi:DNA-binding cell septation regulator SpoVG